MLPDCITTAKVYRMVRQGIEPWPSACRAGALPLSYPTNSAGERLSRACDSQCRPFRETWRESDVFLTDILQSPPSGSRTRAAS